jgi:FlaA1/EpsC-like NDP-sugar epimerase
VGLRPGEKLHEELFISGAVTATRHSKILRSDEPSISWAELRPNLDRLKAAVERKDMAAVEAIVRKIIDFEPTTAHPFRKYPSEVVSLR